MITPYIVFPGTCEEALTFYEKVFKGNILMMQRYGEYIPEGCQISKDDVSHCILHAEMEICNTSFTFADELTIPYKEGNNVYLTVLYDNVEEAEQVYEQLIVNGNVLLAPTETFYSPMHTTLKDKYGIQWNIIVKSK